MSGLTAGEIRNTAGDVILKSSGSIIQVVQTVKTDIFTGVSNTAELLVTGMAASITPTSNTNKIMCFSTIIYGQIGTTYKAFFKRNGTKIFVGDSTGSRQTASSPLPLATDTNQGMNCSICFLDFPATTDELTYQLYVINDNTAAFNLNRSNADTDAAVGGRYVSTVTLMEVVV